MSWGAGWGKMAAEGRAGRAAAQWGQAEAAGAVQEEAATEETAAAG